MYQRQVKVVLFSVALRPLLGSLVVGEVVPRVAAVVILESPSGVVGLPLDARLLVGWLTLNGVGVDTALTRRC